MGSGSEHDDGHDHIIDDHLSGIVSSLRAVLSCIGSAFPHGTDDYMRLSDIIAHIDLTGTLWTHERCHRVLHDIVYEWAEGGDEPPRWFRLVYIEDMLNGFHRVLSSRHWTALSACKRFMDVLLRSIAAVSTCPHRFPHQNVDRLCIKRIMSLCPSLLHHRDTRSGGTLLHAVDPYVFTEDMLQPIIHGINAPIPIDSLNHHTNETVVHRIAGFAHITNAFILRALTDHWECTGRGVDLHAHSTVDGNTIWHSIPPGHCVPTSHSPGKYRLSLIHPLMRSIARMRGAGALAANTSFNLHRALSATNADGDTPLHRMLSSCPRSDLVAVNDTIRLALDVEPRTFAVQGSAYPVFTLAMSHHGEVYPSDVALTMRMLDAMTDGRSAALSKSYKGALALVSMWLKSAPVSASASWPPPPECTLPSEHQALIFHPSHVAFDEPGPVRARSLFNECMRRAHRRRLIVTPHGLMVLIGAPNSDRSGWGRLFDTGGINDILRLDVIASRRTLRLRQEMVLGSDSDDEGQQGGSTLCRVVKRGVALYFVACIRACGARRVLTADLQCTLANKLIGTMWTHDPCHMRDDVTQLVAQVIHSIY